MTLFQRLKAAGYPGSPVSPTDQAKVVAAKVKRLKRTVPCEGKEAPTSRVYWSQQ